MSGCFAVAVVLVSLLASVPTAGATTVGVPYTLPRSGFNITDHNLTYATNMVTVNPPALSSFDLTIVDTLAAKSAVPPALAESEIAIGPGPGGPEEYNITPIFIVQAAATGLLRIEYIPFPMKNTYGFIVYSGTIVPSGPAPFAGHALELRYAATAAGIAPYPVSVPYGQTTGNVSVWWDGQPIVAAYPIAWSSLSAFYDFGLTSDAFASGSIVATMTAGPGPGTGSAPPAGAGFPELVGFGAITAAVLGPVVIGIARRSSPPVG